MNFHRKGVDWVILQSITNRRESKSYPSDSVTLANLRSTGPDQDSLLRSIPMHDLLIALAFVAMVACPAIVAALAQHEFDEEAKIALEPRSGLRPVRH